MGILLEWMDSLIHESILSLHLNVGFEASKATKKILTHLLKLKDNNRKWSSLVFPKRYLYKTILIVYVASHSCLGKAKPDFSLGYKGAYRLLHIGLLHEGKILHS